MLTGSVGWFTDLINCTHITHMVWISVQRRCMLTVCMVAVILIYNFVYAKCIDCIASLENLVSHHEASLPCKVGNVLKTLQE